MRVLVTGAASFVGRHVVTRLLQLGHGVTATYHSEEPRFGGCAVDGLRLVRADLSRMGEDLPVPDGCAAIVHVAALSAAPGVDSDRIIGVNVTGTRNVVAAALRAGIRKIVFMSSLSAHGEILVSEVDERTPSLAPGLYGATKLVGEALLAASADRISSVSIRLPGVLGPGAHRAWLPTVMEKLDAGRDVTIYNPDGPFNNALHVRDLADFVDGLLERSWDGACAFPLAAGTTMRVAEVVELLRSLRRSASRILVSTEPRSLFVVSSAYARTRFGYVPADLERILRDYAAGC